MEMDTHTIGPYLPHHLQRHLLCGVELGDNCAPGTPGLRSYSPVAEGTDSWLVAGWQSNSPFPAFKEWLNNLWLRGDTHPLEVAWGIWGRGGGYGRLLNRGTEIQEFQDDVPKAVNQVPETNGQNNLEEGLAQSTDTRSCLWRLFSLPALPITDILGEL